LQYLIFRLASVSSVADRQKVSIGMPGPIGVRFLATSLSGRHHPEHYYHRFRARAAA
jgi:hypothetical protein